MDSGGFLIVMGMAIGVYFIPAIIATGRSHPNTAAIFILNIFAGWTGICWIAALVWSFTSPARPVVVQAPLSNPNPPIEPVADPVSVRLEQLERLAKLRSGGALTDQEYEQQKRQLIG